MRRVAILLISIVAFAMAGLAFAAFKVNRFMQSELFIPDAEQLFVIKKGQSFSAVSQALVDRGFIEGDLWFRLHVRSSGVASNIQAGEYLISSGATPESLLQQFQSGAVKLHAFTIIEGWNHRELLAALHADEAVAASMTAEDWPALLESLGADYASPEGLFLPETYKFPRGTTDRAVLKQAYQHLQAQLAASWSERSKKSVMQSPYEALILASIIEKETARADEREKIAGVFTRRLQIRMRLQTDPTVIYGIGAAFDGNLTRKHLRTDTPYNTYTRSGLPPTPIAMAGKAAIDAALHPADGEEVYFVATGLGDGSHKFSVTKEEHDDAVAEYLQRLRSSRRSGAQ